MKLKTIAIVVALFAISVPVLSGPNAKASFESLKALARQWETKDPSGKMQTITEVPVPHNSMPIHAEAKRS